MAVLDNSAQFATRGAAAIVLIEPAHQKIPRPFGEGIRRHGNYLVGLARLGGGVQDQKGDAPSVEIQKRRLDGAQVLAG